MNKLIWIFTKLEDNNDFDRTETVFVQNTYKQQALLKDLPEMFMPQSSIVICQDMCTIESSLLKAIKQKYKAQKVMCYIFYHTGARKVKVFKENNLKEFKTVFEHLKEMPFNRTSNGKLHPAQAIAKKYVNINAINQKQFNIDFSQLVQKIENYSISNIGIELLHACYFIQFRAELDKIVRKNPIAQELINVLRAENYMDKAEELQQLFEREIIANNHRIWFAELNALVLPFIKP